MVPKKWYDDALRLIDDLKKQLATFENGMEKYVEKHTYDLVVIEVEKYKKLTEHFGNA